MAIIRPFYKSKTAHRGNLFTSLRSLSPLFFKHSRVFTGSNSSSSGGMLSISPGQVLGFQSRNLEGRERAASDDLDFGDGKEGKQPKPWRDPIG